MHAIMDLIEFENVDLWRIFDEVIAQELFDMSNFSQTVEMARLAYEMELPYQAFWSAMVNIVLLKHQELPFYDQTQHTAGEAGKDGEALIDLFYYIVKSKR